MNLPNERQWQRVEELADDLAKLPPDEASSRISELAAAGESPTVLTLLGTWLGVPPSPSAMNAGSVVGGRYTLREKLGEGGMGTVWRAKQEMIGRDVALKIIHPALVTSTLRARFVVEMEALGHLSHPGIVRIFDAGIHEEKDFPPVPFFVMELVSGHSLDRWAAAHRGKWKALLNVAAGICAAVQSAHERQIVHRDLKPANIQVREDGQPVVLDFGIARLAGIALGEETGMFSGTPQYAAPEQHLGRDRDFRSGESVDVYAVGAMLFELLAGRRLFDFPRGASFSEMRRAILEDPVPRLADVKPECPDFLNDLVARAVRREPSDRFYSMAAFGRAIGRAIKQLQPAEIILPPWVPAPGAIVPGTHWKLVEKIGEGGAGQVWIGAHDQLGEKRVFKFCDTEEKARTLKRELTLFRLLKERVGRNPHFVPLQEVSLDEPPWYLMMDHVEARELASWCASQPDGLAAVPEEARLEIVAQAAEALQAAHEAGILHRDIKPSNLLVRGGVANGLHVFVADFGIGQIVADELLRGGTRLGFTQTVGDFRASPLSGTMLYLAPELLEGNPATARSDIYSLGIVLWQLLIGNLNTALDPAGWATRIRDPLLREDLNRCLAGSPEKRWASAGEFAASLRAIPNRRAEETRRREELAMRERAAYKRGLARATAVAAGIIALVAWLAGYGWRQSKIADRARRSARLSEVAALRVSPSAGKRAAAWGTIASDSVNCPADLKDQLRNEAIAVLALPDVTLLPKTQESFHGVASKNLRAVASVSKDGGISFLKKNPEGRWVASDKKVPPLNGLKRLAISSDGETASALLDKGNANLWRTGGHWQTVDGPFAPAGVALSDDGCAAAARPDGSIDFMEISRDSITSKGSFGRDRAHPLDGPPSTKPRLFPQARPASVLLFSPDSAELASASAHSLFVLIWDTKSKKLVAAGAHKHAVNAIAWNPKVQKELATGAEDGTAIIWNLESREAGVASEKNLYLKPILECRPPTPKKVVVRDVAFGFEGRVLVVLYDDGIIAAFDGTTGQFLDSVDTISPDSYALAMGGEDVGLSFGDETLEIRGIAGKAIFQDIQVFGNGVTAVDADDVGALFVARAHDECAILEPLSLRILHRQSLPYGSVARFNPGIGSLVTIGGGQILVRDRILTTERRSVVFDKPNPVPLKDVVDFDMIDLGKGERIGATSIGGNVTIIRKGQSNPPRIGPIPFFANGIVQRLRIHPSGKWVAALGTESRAPVFAIVSTDAHVTSVPVPADKYLDLCFSPDGRFLALRTSKDVHLIRIPEWKQVISIHLPARVEADAPIAFSGDSRLLLAAGPDAVPVLFHVPTENEDVPNWFPVARLTAPIIRDLTSARFGGPSNCFLILGTLDGRIQTWNFAELRSELRRVNLDWDAPPSVAPEKLAAIEHVDFAREPGP